MAQPRKPASRRTKVLVGLAALAVGWGLPNALTSAADWWTERPWRKAAAAYQRAEKEFLAGIPPDLKARLEALELPEDDDGIPSAEIEAMLQIMSALLHDLRRDGLGPEGRAAVEALVAWHEENPLPAPVSGEDVERPVVFSTVLWDDYQELLVEAVPPDHPYWVAAGRACLQYMQEWTFRPGPSGCSVVLERLVASGNEGRAILRVLRCPPRRLFTELQAGLAWQVFESARMAAVAFPREEQELVPSVSPEEAYVWMEERAALVESLGATDPEPGDWASAWAGKFAFPMQRDGLGVGDKRLLQHAIGACADRERLARVDAWLDTPMAPFPSMEVDEERIERLLRGLPEEGEAGN